VGQVYWTYGRGRHGVARAAVDELFKVPRLVVIRGFINIYLVCAEKREDDYPAAEQAYSNGVIRLFRLNFTSKPPHRVV
jgi:hypothetical protein